MRLLVCAGMTGGGVYPALAVLQAVKDHADQVLWIGSESQMEPALLAGLDLEYSAIPAAGMHGVGFLSVPGNLVRLARGWRASADLIKRFRPHVIFYTGGYIGVPVAMAAGKIPAVVFVPDIEPGFAHHFLFRKAATIAVTTQDSKDHIRANAEPIVTGYPVRKDLLRWNRTNARKHFGLSDTETILLVFGGSKGARSINRALARNLEQLLKEAQIIHISGVDNWAEVQETSGAISADLRNRYHAFPFLHDEMGAALAAADLVICRAGASTLGELPAFGLPAILVPYPHAWRYQARNAQYLAQRGGAVVLKDSAMEQKISGTIHEIIHNRDRLESMKSAMKALHAPHAADQIANLLIKTASSALMMEDKHG
jgi:UDP-N-acetylglucosamine--N-acetylmuramyl-(pentapeptide) pyrophosphoryl-undecaprenol N-acetylglucosamine transferase